MFLFPVFLILNVYIPRCFNPSMFQSLDVSTQRFFNFSIFSTSRYFLPLDVYIHRWLRCFYPSMFLPLAASISRYYQSPCFYPSRFVSHDVFAPQFFLLLDVSILRYFCPLMPMSLDISILLYFYPSMFLSFNASIHRRFYPSIFLSLDVFMPRFPTQFL